MQQDMSSFKIDAPYWAPSLFSPKKERWSTRKKAKAPSAKEKKLEFALFLVFAEHCTRSPVPGP